MQVVGDEFHDMVITGDFRISRKDGRFGRRLDVFFDRHQAILAGLLQDVVEQGHQRQVTRLGVLGALERSGDRLAGRLQHLGLVVHHEGPECAAADHQHLDGQRGQYHGNVAAVDDEAAEHTAQRNEITDDDKHGGLRSE